MNKQGNTYTFLYSVVLVVVVAALLSIVSLSLQPRQNENRQNEKRQNILSAIHISSTAANSAELFDKYIKEQFIINSKGDRIEGKAFDVNIEKQYNLPVEKRELPVFVAEDPLKAVANGTGIVLQEMDNMARAMALSKK